MSTSIVPPRVGIFGSDETASASSRGCYLWPMGYGAAPVDLASSGGATLTSAGDVGGVTQPLATAFISPAQGWVIGVNQTQSANPGDYVIVATADGGRTWATQYRVP